MKRKLFLFAAMAMMTIAASAQKSGSTFLEFQTDFATASGVKPSIGLKGGFLTSIDTNVRLGAGLGIAEGTEFKYAPSMPLFGRAEFLFSGTNVRPFIDVDLGYSLNFEDFESGSVFLNPVVGVNFNKYYIGVGYMGATTLTENSVWTNSISLRLGMRFEGDTRSAFSNFFKRTTFGVEGVAGKHFGSTPNYDGYYSDNLTVLLASAHIMYNINEHWAAGIGANLGRSTYTEHYNSMDPDNVPYDGYFEVFARGEYTFDEIKQDIKPYVNADFGFTTLGTMLSPQVGVKYKDHIRVGLALPYRMPAYMDFEDESALGLELHVGYDF